MASRVSARGGERPPRAAFFLAIAPGDTVLGLLWLGFGALCVYAGIRLFICGLARFGAWLDRRRRNR